MADIPEIKNPDEIEPPTAPSSITLKIMQALDKGLQPGSTEYFQAIGLGQRQNNIIPTSELGILGPVRDAFSSDWHKLREKRINATEVGKRMQMHYGDTLAALRAKHEELLQGAPSSMGMAQAQNPLAFEWSGGINPSLSQIPQPPAVPGQAPGPALLAGISPAAQSYLAQQPMPPSQAAAYLQAVPHALTTMGSTALQEMKTEEARYVHGGVKEARVFDALKAQGLDPFNASPDQIAKARESVTAETERTGRASLNAAMEVVTKGSVTDFTKGDYRQKASALKYAAELVPSARMTITQEAANRSVVPEAYANLHGEDYLKTLPTGKANELRALTNYQLDPSKLASMRTGAREELMQHALQIDPNFSMMEYPARQKVKNDFTSGVTSRNRVAIGQSINHMGTLLDLSMQLANGDMRARNSFVNYVKDQMGLPNVNNYDMAKQAVGTELMRVFRQVNASEQETKAWEARFRVSSSPAQIAGAVRTGVQLLAGRASELNNLWNSSMGTTMGFPNLISPQAQAVLARHGMSLGGGVGSGGMPSPDAIDAELKRRGQK